MGYRRMGVLGSVIAFLVGTGAGAVDKEMLTCSKEEFRRLNKAVGEACKAKPIRCEDSYSCELLKQRFHDAHACFVARQLLMLRCFGGGDEAHKKHLDQVQATIETCRFLLIEKKCDMTGFTAPRLVIQVPCSEPCKEQSGGNSGEQSRGTGDGRGRVRGDPVPGRRSDSPGP